MHNPACERNPARKVKARLRRAPEGQCQAGVPFLRGLEGAFLHLEKAVPKEWHSWSPRPQAEASQHRYGIRPEIISLILTIREERRYCPPPHQLVSAAALSRLYGRQQTQSTRVKEPTPLWCSNASCHSKG